MENLVWQTPLWKMKITNEQYEGIKQELHGAFLTGNTQRFAKEAALYYSEWWRREYNGGRTSKEIISCSLGLSNDSAEELYQLAKSGGRQLRISVITRQHRLWFRSLLMQGGLPMNHIQSNSDNIIVYKTFLKGLIQHTETVSINWNDSSFIENLSCTNYLPLSFKNEGIYELSLLIARAIYEKNDDLLPYDAQEGKWKELTKDLKESSNSETSQVAPFTVRWKVFKSKENLQLSYNVELAKKIPASYKNEHSLEDCNSFSLYVQNQYVATYVRSINDVFVLRESKSVNFKWNGEPVISLQLKKDNNQIIDVTAPNSFVPDLETPQLLVENEENQGFWFFKSGTSNSNKNAVIFPPEWSIDLPATEVHLIETLYQWVDFCDAITLKNTQTGEEITFDNTSSLYSYEFAGWAIDWVQNANYKILNSQPDIRLYNESHIRVPANNVYFREFRDHEWKKYNGNNLPVGLLEFRIDTPDKKYFKEKFYYAGKINCLFQNLTQKSGYVKWEWSGGEIFPVADQEGLEIEPKGNNIWCVSRKSDLIQYPDITKFRFFPKLNHISTPFLEISVASPFKGTVLLDSHGIEIGNNQVLCRSSLYGYRFVIMGQNVDTKVSHYKNPKVKISGQLSPGIHSLSRFEDNIQEMFLLNDSDPFDKESQVMVKIGDKVVYIKEFNLFSKEDKKNDTIFIVDNYDDNNIKDYNERLFGIAVGCSSDKIVVEELVKKSYEGFFLKEGTALEKFILFSDKLADEQVVPRYFDFSRDSVEIEKKETTGLRPQEINILEIKSSLENSPAFDQDFRISEEWEKVILYYNIVINYSLPFKTLNCFRAIAMSPSLMVKMIYLLWQSQSVNKDNLLQGLTRFENELAVAWHWIKESDWSESMDWLLLGMPEAFNCFENRKTFMNYSLNTETGELLNLIVNNERPINEIITAPHKSRIREIREKLGGNENLPDNLVFIPNEWKDLFPLAMDSDLPVYVRGLLLSPVKSALALTGHDDSIWSENDSKMRRTINFYRQFLPAEYAEILLSMVKRILQK